MGRLFQLPILHFSAMLSQTVEFTVPDFFLCGIFNDDVSGLSQSEANAVLAFLYESANDLKKQGFKLVGWSQSDPDCETNFRKYHDANHLGIDACNCVEIEAVYKPLVLLPGE